jgi:uncharacterized phage protein (TIGR01671 family)
MREIKFRAWDLDEKKMVNCEPLTKRELEAYNFMQYTGLFDKNGKEIYEGDIIKFQPIAKAAEYYEVRWGHFGFTYWSEKTPDGQNYLQNNYVEVIGNVYEKNEHSK